MYNNNLFYNVIVIGGGHAGIESSYILSKMKIKTLLITYNIKNIGKMSCNPAIGGIGKSHLVKEIDALGGLMGKVLDKSGIQHKILNKSKGYAVRSTRIQVDVNIYPKIILNKLKKLNKYLNIYEDEVIDLIIIKNCIKGVLTTKKKFYTDIVILTTGTFLKSKIFIGLKHFKGGRINDHSSYLLCKFIKKYPFDFGYLKTGTPPRIDKKSINLNILENQFSENIDNFSFFSSLRKNKKLLQIKCYLTNTNENTHEIIKNNLDKSPLYSNLIIGKGPRYCPSIEDKIVNFPNRKKHNIFLEPESLSNNIIYPNGISTSLPIDVQNKFIHTIKGMEKSVIIQPGYAVEYLFFNPKNLYKTLESKFIDNLFFAGQINGTTGYEEAAAQGLIAGINAYLKVKNNIKKKFFIPDRLNSYIGVLIDDLCSKGVNEPYRMFTSRSEYRLFLREDNADYRLTPIGYKLGLISKKKWKFFKKKIKYIYDTYYFLKKKKINIKYLPNSILNKYFNKKKKIKITLKSLIINYSIKLNKIIHLFKINKKNFLKEIEILIKYEGYLNKQKNEVNKLKKYKKIIIPKNINFNKILNLSKEAKQILNKYKPSSIKEAYQISGITPTSIISIIIYLKKKN